MLANNDWRRSVYRASRLDEFRAYLSGEMWDESEYTPGEFVKRMTTDAPSLKMEAGTAFHALVENAGFGILPMQSKVNGWSIVFDMDGEMALPECREASLYREHKGIPLFGRVDAMDVSSVHDVKTTSSIDPDRYLDSYQWRAYLWMSGRRVFVYDLFRVIVDEDKREIVVKEYVPIKVTAYPGLAADVEALLVEFDATVRALGIPEIIRARTAEIAEGNKS